MASIARSCLVMLHKEAHWEQEHEATVTDTKFQLHISKWTLICYINHMFFLKVVPTLEDRTITQDIPF